ncbi:HEAT repeat domain-containing protein [Pseudomonas sp. AR5]|nr:HEAT repeat domain-containing protein [Pseudomonas sp. AR5]
MPSDGSMRCPAWLCEAPADLLGALRPEDAILQLAFYCALALAGLTLLVLLQVLLLGELTRLRGRRRQAFNDHWRPYFALCSLSDELPEATAPRARNHRLWFLLQWNRTQLQLRGAAHERMNRALVALGMERRALDLLRGRVRARLIGLTCLRHLADPRHWEAVLPLLRNRNTSVALAAAQTLIAMDPARAMQTLLPLAAQRADWALPRLTGLCLQAGAEAVTGPLLALLNLLDEPQRTRMAALLVYGDPRHAASWARARLDEGAAAEALQIALRCLGELADPRDRTRLQRALAHAGADVRLAALEALQRQARRDDSPLFVPLLADSNWAVRQAAADALAHLPGATPERLQHLLQEVDDCYGQDALRRAMVELKR